jgi:hypothetical protein
VAFEDLEQGIKHFIFDLLGTSTYKVPAQETILREVQGRARNQSVDGRVVAGKDMVVRTCFRWIQRNAATRIHSRAELKDPKSWKTKAGLGVFNNFCHPDPSKDTPLVPIYKNAREFLAPDKIAKLACLILPIFNSKMMCASLASESCKTLVNGPDIATVSPFLTIVKVFSGLLSKIVTQLFHWMSRDGQPARLHKNTVFLQGLLLNRDSAHPSESHEMLHDNHRTLFPQIPPSRYRCQLGKP